VSTDTIDYQMNFQDNQQAEADKRLYVHFFKDAVQNNFKTKQEGRPIFDEYDFVKVVTPGSRDTIVTRVSDNSDYARRFPTQWAQYKNNQEQSLSGTPLKQVPWLTVGQIAEFNAVGCRTVEQLVGMPDNLSQKFMGHHQLKQRAQAFLDAAKDAAPLLQLQGELEQRDNQIAELRAMVQAMQNQMTQQAKPEMTPVKVVPKG
jgi:hypothetical protein